MCGAARAGGLCSRLPAGARCQALLWQTALTVPSFTAPRSGGRAVPREYPVVCWLPAMRLDGLRWMTWRLQGRGGMIGCPAGSAPSVLTAPSARCAQAAPRRSADAGLFTRHRSRGVRPEAAARPDVQGQDWLPYPAMDYWAQADDSSASSAAAPTLKISSGLEAALGANTYALPRGAVLQRGRAVPQPCANAGGRGGFLFASCDWSAAKRTRPSSPSRRCSSRARLARRAARAGSSSPSCACQARTHGAGAEGYRRTVGYGGVTFELAGRCAGGCDASGVTTAAGKGCTRVAAVGLSGSAEPSRAEPSRAEPGRAEPSRAEPSRAVRCMAAAGVSSSPIAPSRHAQATTA